MWKMPLTKFGQSFKTRKYHDGTSCCNPHVTFADTHDNKPIKMSDDDVVEEEEQTAFFW